MSTEVAVRRHGRHLPALDGLRAVAALLVLEFHATVDRWSWVNGWAGVPIFFVLSGYLITRLALADEHGDGFSFAPFWVRRLTRIVPLYVLALGGFAVLAVMGYRGGLGAFGRALPYYLTFNAEYAPAHHPMTVAWSLGIEEKFYILWPLLAFAALANRRWRLELAAVGAVACLVVAAVWDLSNVPCYGALFVGCTLAFAEERFGWLHGRAPAAITHPATGWIAAAAVAGCLLSASVVEHNAVYLYLAPVVAVLIAHVTYGASAVRTGLGSPVMTWLGRRSYGIYLFHTLALAVTAHFVSGHGEASFAAGVLGCLVGGIVAADLAHRLVERPCIAWGRQVARQVGRRQATDHASGLADIEPAGRVEPSPGW
ncbi:MAG: acyltransferase family protein [Jatrophihabitans sp.]|uniref:acyltransferase family protein n=1 Tax=Jatrophihabitans sp. TaxID=1932789 RepID=UPI003F7F052E